MQEVIFHHNVTKILARTMKKNKSSNVKHHVKVFFKASYNNGLIC